MSDVYLLNVLFSHGHLCRYGIPIIVRSLQVQSAYFDRKIEPNYSCGENWGTFHSGTCKLSISVAMNVLDTEIAVAYTL